MLGDTLTVFGGRKDTGETVEVVELSFVNEVLEVFDMGYYLTTGKSTIEDGWEPLILTSKEYEGLIDQCCEGDVVLKKAYGFCCLDSPDETRVQLLIRGNQSLPRVLMSVAHEAGHARQQAINPSQNLTTRDSNMAALHEAQAYSFEAALIRRLGEETGLNTSMLPDWPSAHAYIDKWILYSRENVDDLTQEHNRGLLIVWMAVLADPSMSELRDELLRDNILSPESIFKVHNHLIQLPHLLIDSYINEVLIDSYVNDLLSDVRAYHNFFMASLGGRINRSIVLEGFIAHDLTLVLVP